MKEISATITLRPVSTEEYIKSGILYPETISFFSPVKDPPVAPILKTAKVTGMTTTYRKGDPNKGYKADLDIQCHVPDKELVLQLPGCVVRIKDQMLFVSSCTIIKTKKV